MTKSKSTQVFIALLFSLTSFAQNEKCTLVSDTLNYITLDIRSNNLYPVTMCGLGKNNIMQVLKCDNVDSVIHSFYREYFYTPESFRDNHKNLLKACTLDSTLTSFFKQNKFYSSIIEKKIIKAAIHKTIKLKSGETLLLTITKIKGTFWVSDKADKKISTTSNEWKISEIPEIQICYVPLKVTIIKKAH